MKKIILLSLGLFLIGAGCIAKSDNHDNLSSPNNKYQIQIVKSEVNKNTLNLQAKNPTTMKELLSQPEVKYKAELRNGKETVTMLDNVISTASKSWNLYINYEKINFISLDQINLKPEDQIQWRYEAI